MLQSRTYMTFLAGLGLFGLGAPVALAQDPGGVVVEYADDYGDAQAEPQSAAAQAEEFLAEKGWQSGYNQTKNIFIAVGEASVNTTPDQKNFGDARQQAAQQAMMNAKKELALFLSQEVSTELESEFSMGSIVETTKEMEAANNQDPGILEKVGMLVNAELDSMLDERGIDASADPAAAAKVAKEIMGSETFSSAVQVMARQEVGGVQAYKTFESIGKSNQSIAVVGIWSTKSRKLHEALLGKGDPPSGSPKGTISDWARGQGGEVLLYTHGVQPRTNENGEVVLVMFGQAEAMGSHSRFASAAKSQARVRAAGQARQYLGEQILLTENDMLNSSLELYADDSAAYDSSSAFNEKISAKAAGLKMPGVSQAYTWEATHPLNGKKVYGYVGVLSVSAAIEANKLRDVFDSLKGSQGGAGISNVRPDPVKPAEKAPGKGGGRTGGGSGAEGEDP